MRLVFIGTPEFAVPSLHRMAADHDVAAVITQPDRPAGRGRRPASSAVKREADDLGLRVIQPESLRTAEVIDAIRSVSPDVMVAVAYGQILRPEILEIAPHGVLNVHPSLLPRWRGPSPIAGAILAGDEETGVTIMLMDAGMDSGPILAQRGHPISPNDTTGSLSEILAREGAHLLGTALPDWASGAIQPQPQDAGQATLTKLVRKEDAMIEWSLSAVEVWRRIRAYDPWPGAYTLLDGEQIHIWRGWPLPTDVSVVPGTVVKVPENLPDEANGAAFAVSTGDGLLAVLEAQRAGRKRLPSAEFARGIADLTGRRLTSVATAG